MTRPERKSSTRGFAGMAQDKQRAISSRGGKSAHAKGTAHEFSSEEARQAGRKGGLATGRRRRAEGPKEAPVTTEVVTE